MYVGERVFSFADDACEPMSVLWYNLCLHECMSVSQCVAFYNVTTWSVLCVTERSVKYRRSCMHVGLREPNTYPILSGTLDTLLIQQSRHTVVIVDTLSYLTTTCSVNHAASPSPPFPPLFTHFTWVVLISLQEPTGCFLQTYLNHLLNCLPGPTYDTLVI